MKMVNTKEITIPGYEGSRVTVLNKPSWGAYAEFRKELTEQEIAMKMLPHVIIGWNFDDDNGEMPINEESIAKLPTDVVIYLLKEAMTPPKILKKKTSDELAQSSRGTKSV